jgi:uncharacterized protein YjbJ (UPF0337 family)
VAGQRLAQADRLIRLTALLSYVRPRTDAMRDTPYSGFNAWPSGMCFFKELTMNKDQVNGKLQDIGGKIQEKAGELVGNPEQQVKGLKNQVEGKTQEKLGDLKEAVKDATN